MSTQTSIEWTDITWNPVRGCSLVSAGCQNCYAMKQAHRFSGEGMPYEGLTELGPHGPRWTGKITLVKDWLDKPMRWKTPRKIFVNSMSDLFHEDVPESFIEQVFGIMATTPHTYQILTKRPERMRAFMQDRMGYNERFTVIHQGVWPPNNVWLGVSIEDQTTADQRIPILLKTPAAVRWVSAEPLLGPVDLSAHVGEGICSMRADKSHCDCWWDEEVAKCCSCGQWGYLDWVVVGGESGPGARPYDICHIRNIVKQCQTECVPVFVKQLGAKPLHHCVSGSPIEQTGVRFPLKDRNGKDMTEWPADLRVREWPR